MREGMRVPAPVLSAVKIVRRGGMRARLRMAIDGLAAVRISTGGAGVRTGVLDTLHAGPRSLEEVAAAVGAVELGLLAPFLRTLEASGLVHEHAGRWALTDRGRDVVEDPVVRASVLSYGGYHTDLYRGLPAQLTGGPPRTDIVDHGETIAQLSIGFEPFLEEVVRATTRAVDPSRVMDVGCGAGRLLAVMLRTAPKAEGIGIDNDAGAVELARREMRVAGLAPRVEICRDDATSMSVALGGLGGPVDLLLLANVIYYVPVDERIAFLRTLHSMVRPGGTFLLFTTAAEGDMFSRHFDLLLRAQGSGMELPSIAELQAQVVAAGFASVEAHRLALRMPLYSVKGVRRA